MSPYTKTNQRPGQPKRIPLWRAVWNWLLLRLGWGQ